MSTLAPPRRRWATRARPLLAILLTATGCSYAAFGDELLARLSARADRAGRWVRETTDVYRERTEADRLGKARASFANLLACRDTLAGQVRALRDQRTAVAARLDHDSELLRRVLAAGTRNDAPTGATSRDAADAICRVREDEDELTRCDAELARLGGSLDRLDRAVERARLTVQRQADDLDRRRAGAAGGRAFRDGLDLADELVVRER